MDGMLLFNVGLIAAFVFLFIAIRLMRWLLKLDIIAANSIAQTRLLILLANERNISPTNLKWAAGEVEPTVVNELIAKAKKQDSEQAPKE